MSRTRTIIGLAAVFVVALAGTAVANHIYNDVPTNSVFHDEIAEIGDQGCAEGFPGGLFKPEDPVKRQQMARFLSRCGGRAASSSGSDISTGTMDIAEPASVDFLARADGYVIVTATGTASTANEGQCPCRVDWSLISDSSSSNAVTGMIAGDPSQDGSAYASMTVTHVFTISQGAEDTYRLRAVTFDDTVGSVTMAAEISAVYVPFDGTPPNL